MWNIAEPFPSNFKNSVYHFQDNYGIPGLSSHNPHSYSDSYSVVTLVPGTSSYELLGIPERKSRNGVGFQNGAIFQLLLLGIVGGCNYLVNGILDNNLMLN